jgi:hypothetical protein
VHDAPGLLALIVSSEVSLKSLQLDFPSISNDG